MRYEPKKWLQVRWEPTPHFLPLTFPINITNSQWIFSNFLLSAGYFLGVLIFICFILFSNALCVSQGGEKKQKAVWSDEHSKLLGRFWYKINIVPPQGYHDTGLHIRWIVGYHGCLWRGPFPFYTEEKFLLARVWVTQPRNSTSSDCWQQVIFNFELIFSQPEFSRSWKHLPWEVSQFGGGRQVDQGSPFKRGPVFTFRGVQNHSHVTQSETFHISIDGSQGALFELLAWLDSTVIDRLEQERNLLKR